MTPTRFINKKNLYRIKAGSFTEFLYERDSALLESDTEEKEIKARIKIQKAILWININRGFFGQLLANLNVYGSSDPNYPTMATNGLNIQYHPDFVLGQSDAAIRFVLCHEILHCVGEHMSRRGNRNPKLWNYATDYAINPILNAEADANFAWPKNPDGTRMGLFEEKYEGMRAEDIYDDLLQDPQVQQALEQMAEDTNFGAVVDADQDLAQPDSDSSIAQEIMSDEEGEGQPQPGSSGTPSPGQPKPGDDEGNGKKPGGDKPGEGEDDGDKKPEDSQSQQNLVGKKVRVTEGPEKGKIGIVKQVLPNGDIIIE
jgi:hypothetical protein